MNLFLSDLTLFIYFCLIIETTHFVPICSQLFTFLTISLLLWCLLDKTVWCLLSYGIYCIPTCNKSCSSINGLSSFNILFFIVFFCFRELNYAQNMDCWIWLIVATLASFTSLAVGNPLHLVFCWASVGAKP